MQNGWLASAGPFTIEHIPCPDYAGSVDTAAPPKGVLHTTEGGWDGSMSVFRKHYAPHFLVGPGRIAQLLPLGRAAAALEHPSGTPPTNGVARVQIEIVGYSQHTPWLPDIKTLDALAWLMAELNRVADIPLTRAVVGRDAVKFAKATGWLGHADVPGNSHWDPGALDYAALLARAQGHAADDWSNSPLRNRKGYWAWLAWYLGEGDWKPYGARNPRYRPNVPKRVPKGWWPKLAAFKAARSKKR